MDERLRRLERQAAAGDYYAHKAWKAACKRAGIPDPDEAALTAPLTEWEWEQQDYDDLFWHADRRYRLQLWGGSENGLGWYCDNDFHPSLHKAHHTWGHRGWDNKNRKQKTLRTHRNGKHKSRNYRLRTKPFDEENAQETETSHERRRKRRFGGRERLYGCEWVWNPQTERYKIVYWVRIPDLDE